MVHLPRVGNHFDRYRIDAELGSGGMGRVYRAFDPRLRRQLALKVLHRAPTTEGSGAGEPEAQNMQSVLREARAAAAFEHPGKVSIFDVGVFEGTAFIAMEWVSGKPLRALIACSEISFERRLRWLVEVAQVLAAAHDVGLVHRDIKPENVVLRDDGVTKVLDFGIARKVAGLGTTALESALVATTVTLGDSVKGTPLYMAPEQLRGEPLDGRADQFAWATLAIELLTGHHPWASGRNLPEAIAAIVSGAEPTLKKGALPNEVEATLRRALHNDPTLRFGTLRDAIAALQCVAGEARVAGQRLPAVETVPHADNTPAAVTRSVLPPQLRREHRAWLARTASSRHWPWLAGALAAIAIAAIVNFSPAAPLRIPEAGLAALSLYEDPKGSDAQALQSAALWQAAANDFGDAVRQPKAPLRWRAAQALSRGQYLSIKNQNEEGVAQLQRAVNLDPRWALPHLALSQALSRKGDVDGAANEAAEAERLLPKSWRGPYAAGMANSYAGHLAQAVDDFRRALVLAPDHPLVLSDLSLVYHAMRLDNEAAGVSRRALQLDPDVVAPHIVLAEVALECGDSEAAYNHATRALSVFPRSIPAQLAHAEALALSRRLPAATVVVEDVRQALAKQGPGPFQERLNAAEDTLLRTFEQFAADSEQPSLPAPSKPKVTFNVETGVFELDPELGKDRARSRVSRNNVILIERHARSAYPRRRIPLLARSRVDSFRATGSGEHRAAGAGAAARAADRAPAVAAPAPGARRPEPAPKDNLLLRLVRALVSTAKDDLATDGPRDKQPKR